ncbi:protein FAR1-RELATED SEQUENCE [Trifolium repens]|nr:protein FAR1-RELATED SEQUENCE [Trifolium repens]
MNTRGSADDASQPSLNIGVEMSTDLREESDNISCGGPSDAHRLGSSNVEENINPDVDGGSSDATVRSHSSEAGVIVIRDMGDILKIDIVKYLRDLSTKDPLMFVTHSIDKERRLERLFWCDGESRMNYESQLLRITESQEMSTGYIFNVSKYCGDGSVWYVTYCEEPIDFKCCCLRMESIGFPCDHILAVMLYLDFDELPSCLVLPRWSKFAKDSIREKYGSGSLYWDSQPAARYSGIVQMSKVIAELVYDDLEECNHVVDILVVETSRLKHKRNGVIVESSDVFHTTIGDEAAILNPDVVRS